MFEIMVPGIRLGEAKINSSSAFRGSMCFIAGVDSDGYQLMQLPYTTVQSVKSFYPVNKLRFAEDLSDSSNAVDKLTKGDLINYCSEGEYITDRFNKNSLGLTAAYWAAVDGSLSSSAYGRKLYKPGSSTAIGTTGLKKLYVSTGAGGGYGYLWGSTAFSPIILPGFGGSGTATGITSGYVSVSIGISYSNSADAKLRFRVLPARVSKANF